MQMILLIIYYELKVFSLDKHYASAAASNHYVYFYSLNIGLPDCAMPEYIREFDADIYDIAAANIAKNSGNSGNVYCYVEDGDRNMCTMSYYLCRCRSAVGSQHITSWENSIPLYCNVPVSPPSQISIEYYGDDCIILAAESNGYSLHHQ